MKKLQKPKTLRVLCVVFWSLKKTRKSVCVFFTTFCNSSLTYTTNKPSHRSHTIIPLSNHHTIIIPKSHNLRNIYNKNCVFTKKRLSAFSSNFPRETPLLRYSPSPRPLHHPPQLRRQPNPTRVFSPIFSPSLGRCSSSSPCNSSPLRNKTRKK